MSLTFFNMYREQEESKQARVDTTGKPVVTEPFAASDDSTNGGGGMVSPPPPSKTRWWFKKRKDGDVKE